MAPTSQKDTNAQRGTKRKRSDSKKVKAPPPKREVPVEEVIGKKLHHGLQEVRKAAKKAAAFELRKLVKRLKASRGEKLTKGNMKGEDAVELERQLEVLKHIDHEPFANTALKTKILKDRLLSENEGIKTALEKLSESLVQPQEPGSSAAKVHSRLLSSKTISDAVHIVVKTLKEILDPSLAAAKFKEEEEEIEDGEEDDTLDTMSVKSKKVRLAAPSGSGEEGESDTEAAVDEAGWESGTVDGDEDGAGWESGSVDGGDHSDAASSDEDEDEDEDGVSGSEEDGDEAPAAAQPKSKAKTPAKEPGSKPKAGESTFLPSLAVGYTRGDSSASDLSDADAEGDAADAPRKNRRGQRARRMIWEKKYGKNANHVKSQQQQQQKAPRQQQGAGRDRAQSSARPSRGRGGGGTQGLQFGGARPPPTDAGWPKRQPGEAGAGRGAGTGSGTGASGPSEGELHPSWEAKKRLKAKLNPSIVPGQGKKIKF
ncbi:Bud-site selection protein [Lenzites betulinus]|nr:Bud-site selection protein [Lenzites betulinus]